MTDWQPIETAPRDKHVLLYGTMRENSQIGCSGPIVFTGYWGEIDGAWCSTGTTFGGPFFDPTHWQPLPAPPQEQQP